MKFFLFLLCLMTTCKASETWCFSAGGDFLLWQANEQGLDVGVTTFDSTDTIIDNGEVILPKATSYQPGYRLEAELFYTCRNVGIAAEFLALDLSHHFHYIPPGTELISSQNWYFDTGPFKEMFSHWTLQLRWTDIEAVARWDIGHHLSLLLGTGLRFITLDQKYTIKNIAFSDDAVYDISFKTDSHGVGPKMNFVATYDYTFDSSLFVDFSARGTLSFPYLHYKVKCVTPIPSQDVTTFTLEDDVRLLRSIAQLGFGATLGYSWSRCLSFGISYFYDWSFFWKQNMMRSLVDLANYPTSSTNVLSSPGNLYFQGHSISATVSF